MNTLPETTINATRVAVPYTVQITNMGEAMQFAELIAQSAFVPKELRGKPADCLLAMQFGAELGLQPMQSLQNVAVINGKPSIWGDAALALVKCARDFVSIDERIEGDALEMVAICTVQRKGETPQTRTFSVDDAKRAGLWGKRGYNGNDTPWITYPKRMLQMRARGFALRDVFPHVLKGLIFAEEAQDYPVEPDIKVIPAAPVPVPVPDEEHKQGTERIIRLKMRHFGLQDEEKRILNWCKTKFNKSDFQELTDDEMGILIRQFDTFRMKISNEKFLNEKRTALISEIQMLCDMGTEDLMSIAERHYGDMQKLNEEQIKSAWGWVDSHKKIMFPELFKIEQTIANARESAQYAETHEAREADAQHVAELKQQRQEIIDQHIGHQYEIEECAAARSALPN